MGALTIRGIRKVYGKVEILKTIDIDIDAGEFLILVGPSGCGKSTLLNIVAGLDSPTSGSVHIGGRDVTRLPSKDRDIAMVFQSYALYPNMTVRQNIAFGLEIRKLPREQREQAVQRVAQMLQIGHLLDRKPGQLSGGQRQRVAMGRALARDPKLFLFDEPLSNLDAKLRVEMRAEIKRLHQRTRTTTVYVTHDQVEAMTLGDRIAVMNGGVVQQFDTPEAIYARPATRFVAEFIGSPAMNLIDVRRDAGGVSARGVTLALSPSQRQALAAAGDAGGQGDEHRGGPEGLPCDFHYGVRPEDLSFGAAGLPGVLSMIEPTGPETYATADTTIGPVTARVPGVLHAAVGDAVHLSWDPVKSHLFAAGSQARVG